MHGIMCNCARYDVQGMIRIVCNAWYYMHGVICMVWQAMYDMTGMTYMVLYAWYDMQMRAWYYRICMDDMTWYVCDDAHYIVLKNDINNII